MTSNAAAGGGDDLTPAGQWQMWLIVAVVLGAIAAGYAIRAGWRWARRDLAAAIAERAGSAPTGGQPMTSNAVTEHWCSLEKRDLPGPGPRVQSTRAVCGTCGWASAWMLKPRAIEAGLAHSGRPVDVGDR